MLQPLQNYELEILKNLTQKAQLGQADSNELTIMKNYTDRYMAYNPQVQQNVQPQYNQPMYNQQVQPQYNQQMLPPQYNQPMYNMGAQQNMQPQFNQQPISRYNQPFTSIGNSGTAPTANTTFNNGTFKYADDDHSTPNIYNQRQREEAEKEKARQYNEALILQQQAKEAPVVAVVKKPSIPYPGSEIPWLVPPHFYLSKKEDGFAYEYEVHENNGVVNMNFRDHESIYNERVESEEYVIKLVDENNISFDNEAMVANIETAMNNSMLNVEFAEDEVIKHIVKPYSIVTPIVAKKVSTDEVTSMFADIITRSESLIALSIGLKRFLDSKDEINKKAVIKLDEILTANTMLVLENVLNSNFTIESFINDIADLYVHIDKITDGSKKKRITNALLNMLNSIKADNEIVYKLIKDESTESNIGTTYYIEKVTVIVTNSDEIHYEINNLERKSLVAVKNEITPVLDDLINKVKSKYNTFKTYIVDYKTGNVYLTMKNSNNKMNTVIRVQ